MPLLRACVAGMSQTSCGTCQHHMYCKDYSDELKSCSGYEQGPRLPHPPAGWFPPSTKGLEKVIAMREQLELGGRKNDLGKLRWDLVQPLILQEYVKVLTEGAKKYAPNNWRKVEDARNRYFAALLRHIWAWWLGERNDPEWDLHHLAHAMCCLTFLAEPELELKPVSAPLVPAPCRHYGLVTIRRDGKPACSICGEVLVEPCPDCGSTSGKCVIGTETSPNDPVVMGKQFAVELEAAKLYGPGLIDHELGARLLYHYGWMPRERAGWKHPFQNITMSFEDALGSHGYRLATAEDMVESDHGHPTDNGGVRGTDSSGSEGSGG